MKEEIKYRVATRCPLKLPKVHTGREWLALIGEGREICVGGVVLIEGVLCALKHAGAGEVIARPLSYPPCPAFSSGLSSGCVALMERYAEQWRSGDFTDAVLAAKKDE